MNTFSAHGEAGLIDNMSRWVDQSKFMHTRSSQDHWRISGISQIPPVKNQSMARHLSRDRESEPLAVYGNIGIERVDTSRNRIGYSRTPRGRRCSHLNCLSGSFQKIFLPWGFKTARKADRSRFDARRHWRRPARGMGMKRHHHIPPDRRRAARAGHGFHAVALKVPDPHRNGIAV